MLLIDHLDLPLFAIIFGVALASTAILADATIRGVAYAEQCQQLDCCAIFASVVAY